MVNLECINVVQNNFYIFTHKKLKTARKISSPTLRFINILQMIKRSLIVKTQIN